MDPAVTLAQPEGGTVRLALPLLSSWTHAEASLRCQYIKLAGIQHQWPVDMSAGLACMWVSRQCPSWQRGSKGPQGM